VGRVIPKYIGIRPIPETRSVTVQLLKCWSNLLGEYDNIMPLFRDLDTRLATHMFIAGAQDIAMYLSNIMIEKNPPVKRIDLIYVGQPRTQLGAINCRVAGILHRFWDEPDYNIRRGKHRPVIPTTSSERKQELEDCCKEEKKENEVKA
jgi:hypothetical protein